MKLTIGTHNLQAGTALKIEESGIVFSCAQDSHATEHPYPRSTILTAPNISNAMYDPAAGLLTVTTAAVHGFTDGDKVKFADNAITFTCSMDSNATNHPYPRSTDPASGKWLEVDVTSTTEFTCNVGRTPSVVFDPSMVVYDPSTGIMVMTIGAHDLTVGTSVRIANNSITFKCAQDNYATDHSYPRSTDPFYDTSCPITAVTDTTISVQVLSTVPSTNVTAHTWQPPAKLTPTNATYNPSTGDMEVTVANHGLMNGEHIRIDENAFTFTCNQDSNATNHAYPRSTDPAYHQFLPVSNVTQNTFQVTVLAVTPSTNTTTHAFVSAVSDSITRGVVRSGGIYTHAFVSAVAGSLSYKKDQAFDSSVTIKHEGTPLTPTGASYSGTTGICQITSNNHGLIDGDYVKLLSLIPI